MVLGLGLGLGWYVALGQLKTEVLLLYWMKMALILFLQLWFFFYVFAALFTLIAGHTMIVKDNAVIIFGGGDNEGHFFDDMIEVDVKAIVDAMCA